MQSVELFAGAGGLALGISRAGFRHLAVVEWDEDACNTLNENKSRVPEMRDWPVIQADVRRLDFSGFPENIDLLAGGVPCQPFSIGGKHRGDADERNMFPEMVRAIRTLKPKAVLIENVRGLARPSFSRYFGYIELMLMYPELHRRSGESWQEHLRRLEQHHTRGTHFGLSYRVVHRVLNAADYGIPQRRERLFFVAIRSDLKIEWSFPAATHSADSLLWQQYVTRQYWDSRNIPIRQRTRITGSILARVEALSRRPVLPYLAPWATVRDAIENLGQPYRKRALHELALTHFLVPGARSYAGHTGSPLDEAAKTLKAGVHGVPGGENTVVSDAGQIRYFTVREAARVQTFPDEFTFPGSWTGEHAANW